MCNAWKYEKEVQKRNEEESSIHSLDTDEAKKLDTYYSSTEPKSDDGVLKEGDSINRTTPGDTENSESMSQSDKKSNSKADISDRIVSTDKSESDTSSVKSISNRSQKSEIMRESRDQGDNKENCESENDDEVPDAEYMDEFTNHLSELD